MGNAYMEKQQQMQQYYFETGEAVGFQRCLDYMQCLLKNPKYMGKDTFGRKRWEKLYKGLKECDQVFGEAFTHGRKSWMAISGRSSGMMRCLLRSATPSSRR